VLGVDKDILNELLLLAVPVIAAAAALAAAWMRAKAEEISRKSEEDELKHNMELLDKVVTEVAETFSRKLVEELGKAHSDGCLSCEDVEKVKYEALQRTYSILDESIIEILKKGTTDLDCLICSKIESSLCQLKEWRQDKLD
jgi:hypothetical protein